MKTLSDKQRIFSQNVAKLITYIYAKSHSCSLGEVYRTPEQAEIYAKNGKGVLNSLHCKRLAIDLNIFSPEGKYLPNSEDYKIFGEYWELLDPNNKWGGKFPLPRIDGNHFQMNE